MGQLVFQATLGGAVNLIGPNIAGTVNFTLPSADGTSGQTWTTNGSGVLSFGTLGIAGGGTGQTSANAALNALLPVQTSNANKYLQTNGTNTSWDAISLSTADITGVLPTANGGTNLTSFTSGGVVYASSSSALATGSGLTFDGTNLGLGGTTNTYGSQTTLTLSGSNVSRIDLRSNGVFTGTILSYQGITEGLRLQTEAGYPIVFSPAQTEAGRFTAAGNFGIGTSSPAYKLSVVKPSAGITARFTDGDGITDVYGYGLEITRSVAYIKGSSALHLGSAAGYSAVVLDASGNVGLGVTPSAWSGVFNRAMQVGSTGALADGSGYTILGNNWYYNGANYYLTTAAASRYYQNAGKHIWEVAASGTANTSIPFTQAMTLDASGRLLVGTTSGSGATMFTVNQPAASTDAKTIVSVATGTNAAFTAFVNTTVTTVGTENSSGGSLVSGSSAYSTVIANNGAYPISFGTNNTERARITSSGDLYVGTTTGSIGTANFGVVITQAGSVIGSRNENGSVSVFYYGGNAGYAQILGNGNLQNSNGVYAAISDVKLKENIVDASPKLADLMQVKVRNYNLIGDTTKQIGVIAQELETVFPALIDETNDTDAKGNDLGTKTKAVKYSVFVPMLIKAMQEQQAIIESLKARLDAANL